VVTQNYEKIFSEKYKESPFLAFFRVVASNQIFPHFENAKVILFWKIKKLNLLFFIWSKK